LALKVTVETQCPATQLAPVAHTLPHAPQLAASAVMDRSQPSPGSELQSAKPALHVAMPHAEAAQNSTAFGRSQTVVHPPQWAGSIWRLVHAPEQFVRPAPQDTRHALPEQSCPAGQTVPHPPQLALSALVSRQTPAQLVSPVAQETLHEPEAQT
jgi:hypothetical protein